MNCKPLVSIWCTAYNHEKYIKDAIESFLMQKTDFKFEVVIHDDASTDNTTCILKDYEKKYPQLIRVIYEKENQYSKHQYPPQFVYGMMRQELKGDYVAWCEGDDYWIDPNKLQIQIDYMETHSDCVMTGHDAVLINCRDNKKECISPFSCEKDLSYLDVLERLHIPTASLVFKKEMLYIDDDFLEMGVGDYPLRLYCVTKGKVHYFDKAMSVYRYLTQGSWSSNQRYNFNDFFGNNMEIVSFLNKFSKYMNRIPEKALKNQMSYFYNIILCEGKARQLSTERFIEISKKIDREHKYKNHIYHVNVEKAYRQLYDLTYVAPVVFEFIRKNKRILIWGAGNYAGILGQQLKNNELEYEGFVVSDDQPGADNYNGKKVWRVSEMPFSKNDVGVLIAVRTELKDEILTALQSAGIQKYLYPFDIICNDNR